MLAIVVAVALSVTTVLAIKYGGFAGNRLRTAAHHVDGDPAHSSEETKVEEPLAAAEVQVADVEGNPGCYTAEFFLRPRCQLEGLTVSLRLVSKLPSAKAG